MDSTWITYGPDENCTLALCPVSISLYEYRPSLAANTIFIVLFGIALCLHLFQGIKWRSWAFLFAMFWGCVAEMIGYGGRILMWQNPFSFPGFLTQIICITIGPAFFSAAIYLTLSRVVIYLGVEHSRFSPKLYYWLFIPCDIVSLTLQAAGGASSSTSSGNSKAGVDIAIAGLSFQVFTLAVFIGLAIDYAIRYARGQRARPSVAKLPTSFKVFAGFLSLAIVLILIRCCYRIDELSNGYSGPLIHNQGLFIGLEGVMIILAAFALNVAHPGPIFGRSRATDPEDSKERTVARAPTSSE
ncbi:RTA1 like protein-domain-containing protein [Cryomyces antarcticus]|uniref:Parasitic phase-specific protein psp-1 n=1 Tax=Cryomyces antarcticus TaxID=329879 RepID=A0ABR0LSJ6_9PEZI|nr:Envelope glycoprotein gp160 [Cryomyces antarcticus]KAK5020506.1 Envelope glycoprotein gp160 [Cryomyces antarcticus]KAK5201906.1 parasitic phase-specific protein psp-1 [Cryomyces antarcticus]